MLALRITAYTRLGHNPDNVILSSDNKEYVETPLAITRADELRDGKIVNTLWAAFDGDCEDNQVKEYDMLSLVAKGPWVHYGYVITRDLTKEMTDYIEVELDVQGRAFYPFSTADLKEGKEGRLMARCSTQYGDIKLNWWYFFNNGEYTWSMDVDDTDQKYNYKRYIRHVLATGVPLGVVAAGRAKQGV